MAVVEPNKKLRIVIIDDSYVLRHTILSFIYHLCGLNKNNIEFLTSSNGLEGLGLVIATNPDIIILDSTLPKYSGRELIEFLLTNPKLEKLAPHVILLVDKNTQLLLPPNYVTINKHDASFIDKVMSYVSTISNDKMSCTPNKAKRTKFLRRLSTRIISLTNKCDDLIVTISKSSFFINTFNYVKWILFQIRLSILLSILFLLYGRIKEANIDQKKIDLSEYRIRYYPTLASMAVGLFVFALQFAAYLLGGLIIFGVNIESVLADRDTAITINFEDTEYDRNEIAFGSNSSLVLKSCTESQMSQNGLLVMGNPTDDYVSTQDQSLDLSNINEIEKETIQESPESCYYSDAPSVTFLQGIQYTDLFSLQEDSNINNFDTSLYIGMANTTEQKQSFITYQLSPDKFTWYYCENGAWLPTNAGSARSNNVQEVNSCLDTFRTDVGGNTVYLRAYFISDGKSPVTLNNLVLTRTLSLIYTENARNTQISSSQPLTFFDQPQLSILNAAPKDGILRIRGRLDLYGINQSDFDPDDYKIYIYTSDTNTISDPQSLMIGETVLKSYLANGTIQYYYQLEASDISSNYLYAKVINVVTGREYISNPVEKSTFTVTTTVDADDASQGNGICDTDESTPGVQCSLRAAIQEANRTKGKTTIHFSIPTQDDGYLDYDLPQVLNSGDMADEDNYWSIRPNTQLPAITHADTYIDGHSQEVNIGDQNIYGPDIEISGQYLSDSTGLRFAYGADNCSVDDIIINDFHSGQGANRTGITVFAQNFTLTSSFLGLDALGESILENSTDVLMSNSMNSHIGTSIETGNIFASSHNISIVCTIPDNTLTIAGNIFGWNAMKTRKISAAGNAIQYNDTCSPAITDNTGLE